MTNAFDSLKLWVAVATLAFAGAVACGEDEETQQSSGGTGGTSSGGKGGSGGGGALGGSGGSGGASGSGGTGAVDGGGAGGSTGSDAGGDAEGGPSNVAYPGAPPTMLHNPYGCATNCLTCHGSGSGGAPQTPHPERLLCRQCHLPQANVPDFVPNNFGK